MKTAEKIKKPKAPTLEQYQGYLFARLHLIGSFSQGPCYYLQPLKGEDLLLFKRVELWKDDPVLHACLGRKVTVFGSKIKKSEEEAESEPGIRYAYLLNEEIPLEIRLDLGLPDDTLWINKMPAPSPKYPPELKKLPLKLSVRWPYREEEGQERSIWSGECPTSQLFDFGIEDPHGHTIWQWGNCMLFRPEPTKVEIPGGSPKTVKVPWFYFEDSIAEEGLYVAKARFIASGQEVRKPFRVEFVY